MRNTIIIIALIIISVLYFLLSKKNYEQNNYIIENERIHYVQGEVITYIPKEKNNINNCEEIDAKVINFKNKPIAKAYCIYNNGNIQINIDSSEFQQGNYSLMITENNKKTISNEKFNVELMSL